MFVDPPRGSRMVVDVFALVADRCLVRIRLAVESHDRRARRDSRGDQPVERKGGPAMALEAAHPLGRPELHARADAVGEIRLGRTEVRQRPVFFTMKLLPHECTVIQVEAENGRVADQGIGTEKRLMARNPIMNDGHVADLAKREEVVERTGDHDIEVEKQPESLDRKVRAEEAEFAPAGDGGIGRQVDRGDRKGVYAGVETGRVIGEADKTMRLREVARHGPAQLVDVIGAIARAPLKGNDVKGKAIHAVVGRWAKAHEGPDGG